MAHRIDGFVFVVEWGRTARRMVRSTFQTEPQVAEKCLGVILNKADIEKMKLYRSYGSGNTIIQGIRPTTATSAIRECIELCWHLFMV